MPHLTTSGAPLIGRPIVFWLTAGLIATAAAAAERPLTGAEIRDALTGHMFRHADVTQTVLQTFRDGGVTYYYDGSEQSEGRWEVRKDQYCALWPPSKNWSCYVVTGAGGDLTFISTHGARFPVILIE